MIQTDSESPTEFVSFRIVDGDINMPDPITDPQTNEIAPKSPIL